MTGLLCISNFCHRHSLLPLFNFCKCHCCHHFYLGDPHFVCLNPTTPIYTLPLNLRNKCFGLDESATQLNDVVCSGWNHSPFERLSVGPMTPVCSSGGVLCKVGVPGSHTSELLCAPAAAGHDISLTDKLGEFGSTCQITLKSNVKSLSLGVSFPRVKTTGM